MTGGMDRWDMFAPYGSPVGASFLSRDWKMVNELSDVSVRTWDLNLGARWRLPSGYGLELGWTLTDYHDNDPILEDESGRYNVLSVMVSRSF